jgi:hypothetical protein
MNTRYRLRLVRSYATWYIAANGEILLNGDAGPIDIRRQGGVATKRRSCV